MRVQRWVATGPGGLDDFRIARQRGDQLVRGRVVEVERPIREQGIYKRDVKVGHNVWIGYGGCVLRGVTVGEGAVVGATALVTRDVPAGERRAQPSRAGTNSTGETEE